MKHLGLDEYLDVLRGETKDHAACKIVLDINDHAPPQLLHNLAKLSRLGLLNGDVLMSLVAQAPVDPLNLYATISSASPGQWVFSSIDFGAVRILARGPRNEVIAAIRIDLMDSSVSTLVMNKAGQLTPFQRYEPHGPRVLEDVQAACDAAIFAAKRERGG